MATDQEFQALQTSGQKRTFTRKSGGHTVYGVVKGNGVAIVTDSSGNPAKTWKIEEASGGSYEVWSGDYTIS